MVSSDGIGTYGTMYKRGGAALISLSKGSIWSFGHTKGLKTGLFTGEIKMNRIQHSEGAGTESQVLNTKGEAVIPYVTPNIRVMDEKEVLSAFQVTVAGVTWWVM